MALTGSRRLRRSAQRFRLRRLDYAVLGRRMPRERDPLRAQNLALLSGCVIAAGGLILSTIIPALRHDTGPGDAALVLVRQSGALFVRVDQRLRPVANLTSARLILGSAVDARVVDESALGDVAPGPVLGIPGAPPTPGAVTAPTGEQWAVCDDPDGATTVALGKGWAPEQLSPHSAVVAAAADGSAYLLYDGRRAAIDPQDPSTSRALHLDGVRMRAIAPAVLNAIPEVPAIAAPRIAGRGEPSGVPGLSVGTVVAVTRAGSVEHYVALRDGVQRVGRLAVDLLRFADPDSTSQILTLTAGLISSVPLVDALAVATYPDEPPRLVDVTDGLCATWANGHSGLAIPASAEPEGVVLAGADGAGPRLDRVRFPPGRSMDVTAGMLTTDTGPTGRFLITDSGIRFPIHDSAAAEALGLPTAPAPVPWAIIGVLPAGPELSRDAALVVRDVALPAP
ncbi:type VII secretion protein EccB [Mycolicibacterium sp. CBM1]